MTTAPGGGRRTPPAPLGPRRRRNLSWQGFGHVAPEILAGAAPALRLTFLLCGAAVGVAGILGEPWLPWLLAFPAAAGALLPHHPLDRVGAWVLRRAGYRCSLPRHQLPRRLAFALGSVWLLGMGGAFHLGLEGGGRGMAGLQAAVALVAATSDFLLPAWILSRLRTQTPGTTRTEISGNPSM